MLIEKSKNFILKHAIDRIYLNKPGQDRKEGHLAVLNSSSVFLVRTWSTPQLAE
jgi:hypothetical protein